MGVGTGTKQEVVLAASLRAFPEPGRRPEMDAVWWNHSHNPGPSDDEDVHARPDCTLWQRLGTVHT